MTLALLALLALRLSRFPVAALRDALPRVLLREPRLETLLPTALFFLFSPAICSVLPVVPVGCKVATTGILHMQALSGQSSNPSGVRELCNPHVEPFSLALGTGLFLLEPGSLPF